jgi:glutamate-ammonia-ligase adenylyltransferase
LTTLSSADTKTARRHQTLSFYSPALARIASENPSSVDALFSSGRIERPETTAGFLSRLAEEAEDCPAARLPALLARFRRLEFIRILLRDVEGLADLAETTAELSHLADAILQFACRLATGSEDAGLAILALGKLGGEELNYSSDVDLMFVFRPGSASAEFHQRAAAEVTRLLSQYTEAGICYRVDLRLRPEGRLGELALSSIAARDYYQRRARPWELQMLIKARVVAGDRETGAALCRDLEPLIYSAPPRTAIDQAGRNRASIHQKAARAATLDVKLMPGGIRDIEFLVQVLQRVHGEREPWVRGGSTLVALRRLHDKDLLAGAEYAALSGAYRFFRYVEHRLQIEEDRQTHTLPAREAGLDLLARRLPPGLLQHQVERGSLLATLEGHRAQVNGLYERVLHQRAAAVMEPVSIYRRDPYERFTRGVPGEAAWEEHLDENPVWRGRLEDVMAHSGWLTEALNADPSLAATLDTLAEAEPAPGEPPDSLAALRQTYRREMFRILARSLCLQAPIFETLEQTSALADRLIEAAYALALGEVGTRQNRAPDPQRGLMTIALGRLGMLEFDLASDADLLFVVPDSAPEDLEFWTRVAERMIEALSAYTADGTLFAVDTRLRPGGRDGSLVQTETAVRDYFERRAEAWEGIAYMKARAVAGDLDRGTRFLAEIQQIDWRRYGQGGRSRGELRDMRARLEREQGPHQPLKAGFGGYYDIDFALMFLRLRGAGFFFRALNTPRRIDIVEQMGHLDRADAGFLRDAATFYRAVDHALRLETGHSAGNLPVSEKRQHKLKGMVQRWTPSYLIDQPLADELKQIQHRTREYFDRLFTT